MTDKFTPGPWRVQIWNRGGSGERTAVIAGGASDRIDVADVGSGSGGTIQANAALIASAPRMLDALRDALPDLETFYAWQKPRGDDEEGNQNALDTETTIAAVREAIRAATGEAAHS